MKIGDIIKKSKYKNYTPNWSVENFMIKKVKKALCHRHLLLVILTQMTLLEHFTKGNCKETNQKDFRVEKVIKRKDDKLYVQ